MWSRKDFTFFLLVPRRILAYYKQNPLLTLELPNTILFFKLMDSVPRTHEDDEYANASEKDPKILLTTSRDPSQPLTQFAKVIIQSIPMNSW